MAIITIHMRKNDGLEKKIIFFWIFTSGRFCLTPGSAGVGPHFREAPGWSGRVHMYVITGNHYHNDIYSRHNDIFSHVIMTERYLLVIKTDNSCHNDMYLYVIMAAFRYPHHTRPNSGPDMKISTEPIVSLPEPSGSKGELIVYQCSGVRRRCRSFTMFKHLLWNRLAIQSQTSHGASLGRRNKSLYKLSRSHDQYGRHAHIW